MVKFVFDGGFLIYKYSEGKRRYLFLKGRGHLDLPKGHIEKGETSLQAAVREAFEETSIRVTPDRYFIYHITFWYMENNQKVKTELTVYLAKVGESAKVKVTEHSGYVWLTYEQVMSGDVIKNERDLVAYGDSYIEKREALDRLNEEYAKLPRSFANWNLSRNFVPGEGPSNAGVMIIGQAPGRNEDMQKRPFVGASGKLLDHLLRLAGLNRDRVYITSVVQFFPPKNRQPSSAEIESCRSYLLRQIDIIKPKLIVLLGAVAARELIGGVSVMRAHSNLFKDMYFVTLHPAAAVRLKKNVPIIENDFRKLKGVLKELRI
ncbi:MAG: uracil-DNA glycosylase family protein [Candidatus Micrarchaeia archaeon]